MATIEPVAVEGAGPANDDTSIDTGHETVLVSPVRPLRRAAAALRRPGGAVGFAIITVAIAMAAVSLVWTPYPTWQQDLGIPDAGTSAAHLLGLDTLGRDVLSRLMVGCRVSLEIGAFTLAAVLIIGIVHGVVSGYFGGITDQVLMAVLNFMYGIPSILVAIVAGILLGRGVVTLSVAIALSQWMPMALVIRGQTLTLKHREYVLAARVSGTPVWRILGSHILPNTSGPMIVQCSYIVPQAILTEAFLSFLGLGVPPPTPTWGGMASDGYQALQLAPHVSLVPAFALCILLLGFYLLGDALRDAFDPRQGSWT